MEDASVTDVSIRIANEVDFEPARAVLGASYAEYEAVLPPTNWVAYLADILDLEGRDPESDLLVAEIEGRVVGCVSYFPPGAKASYPSDGYSEHWPAEWSAVRLLAVDPGTRGAGVGRRLTEACIARAREQGAKTLGLHTTAPMKVARAMYERMGFERTPRYDFKAGTVAVEAYSLNL